MKKNISTIVLSLFLLLNICPPQVFGLCQLIDFEKTIKPKLLEEQKTFEEKLYELVKKPDTSTPYLTEQGVKYIKKYHKTIKEICSSMYEEKNKCDEDVTSENFTNNGEHQKCLDWIDKEISLQRRVFEKLMINDAASKKFQFVVNKYKELNKKFRDLVALVGMIRGELERLLKNIGKMSTKQHQGAN